MGFGFVSSSNNNNNNAVAIRRLHFVLQKQISVSKKISRHQILLKKRVKCQRIKNKCHLGSIHTLVDDKSKKYPFKKKAAQGGLLETCLLSLHDYMEKIKVIIPDPIQRMMDAGEHLTTIPVPVCHGCVFRCQKKKVMQCHRDHLPWCQKAQFKYDGYLVLPEFNFMINTSLSSSRVVDVRGFGEEPGLRGVLHFVIDPKLAHNIATSGARCLAASDAAAQVLHCKSVYLWCSDVTGKRRKCLVDLIILQGHKFKPQSKAMKPEISDFPTFTADQINNTLMFTFANRKPKHEVTIIVGTFHNNAMAVINELYDALSNRTMKNNIERMRFGQSSGILDGLSPAFFKMLDDPNFLPRWWTATMIIPERSHIRLVYINRDGIPKSFRYSVPQFGGQLSIDRELFFNKKFNFFTPFMESKIAAALLLQDLSRSDHLNIVPLAVKHVLSNWQLAQETAQTYGFGDHEAFVKEYNQYRHANPERANQIVEAYQQNVHCFFPVPPAPAGGNQQQQQHDPNLQEL
eukprot:jgi/Psemu1/46688/gm1.46688_g